METFGLEEDGNVADMSPEVSDRVATVATTCLRLQDSATVGSGTWLAKLLPPGLVTNGRPDGHLAIK